MQLLRGQRRRLVSCLLKAPLGRDDGWALQWRTKYVLYVDVRIPQKKGNAIATIKTECIFKKSGMAT